MGSFPLATGRRDGSRPSRSGSSSASCSGSFSVGVECWPLGERVSLTAGFKVGSGSSAISAVSQSVSQHSCRRPDLNDSCPVGLIIMIARHHAGDKTLEEADLVESCLIYFGCATWIEPLTTTTTTTTDQLTNKYPTFSQPLVTSCVSSQHRKRRTPLELVVDTRAQVD